MNNKKKWLLTIVTSFIMIKVLPAVTAYSSFDISQGPTDLIRIVSDFFTPIFQALLGYEAGYDQYFFARILLLIIVFIISSIALESIDIFKSKKGLAYIVAAAVAILGARYIGELNFIQAILLPYGAVTIALSILLPFIVFFFFVHNAMKSGIARRAAWIFFAVIFIGLWWTRRQAGDLGDLSWIYDVGIVAVIAAVIWDSKLHEYFGLAEAAEFRRGQIRKQIADVEAELSKYANIQNPSKTTQEVIKHLEQRRLDLAKKL